MHHFGSPEQVEELLERLADDDEPLTLRLARQPGQKGERWMHLVGGTPVDTPAPTRPDAPIVEPGPSLRDRVAELESRLERLERTISGSSDFGARNSE
jgi:uncharacterized protein YceH (UPF0502 family)